MSAFELNDAARRNLRAQALGYRNHYERRRDTTLLRNLGFSLSNPANRRAMEGFLRSYGGALGLSGPAQPSRPIMQSFIGLVQRMGLNRAPNGYSVSALLEDRGIVSPDDHDWSEWWAAYV